MASLCSRGVFRHGDWLVPEMDETEPMGLDVGVAWAAETVSSVSFYVSLELWSLARVSWSAVGSEVVMRVRSHGPWIFCWK